MSATEILSFSLGLILGLMSLLFIIRIILTWYPDAEQNQFPFYLVVWPTEPFLLPMRKLVPPIGGVDISPIIWVGLVTLVREFLVGQQGLLKLLG